jgi:hypothetical protein
MTVRPTTPAALARALAPLALAGALLAPGAARAAQAVSVISTTVLGQEYTSIMRHYGGVGGKAGSHNAGGPGGAGATGGATAGTRRPSPRVRS